ncbi:hypothetical protein RB4201 [Rhodopirellula baltica SH 1]|uniref:FRG domain-containing protein n=2 Tax=Rhodopirellula baltica TaxID=265606 RepID=Q7UT04_RHOBA|nr:hypothetical protein RB4201 [Rhodopirellula baltica SH 1]
MSSSGARDLMYESRNVDRGVQTRTLDSWKDFYALIADDLSNKPAYIFRGQADADWLVDSSLDRLEKRFPTKPNRYGSIPQSFNCPPVSRERHLTAFRQAIRGRRGSNPPQLDDDESWALAQHHGLATPMLDWTLLPFAALFFAFEDELVLDAGGKMSPPDNRAVFALSTSVIGEHSTESDPSPRLFSPTTETSSRLVAQSGLFLKMPKQTDLEGYVQKHFSNESSQTNLHARAVLIKMVIKNDDRSGCLQMLNKMNINRMTLFPDLDGASRYINALWEIDFDTSLGYIGDESP